MKNKRISAKVIASLVTMMLALTIVGNTTTSAYSNLGFESLYSNPYLPEFGTQYLPKVKAQEEVDPDSIPVTVQENSYIKVEDYALEMNPTFSAPFRYNDIYNAEMVYNGTIEGSASIKCTDIRSPSENCDLKIELEAVGEGINKDTFAFGPVPSRNDVFKFSPFDPYSANDIYYQWSTDSNAIFHWTDEWGNPRSAGMSDNQTKLKEGLAKFKVEKDEELPKITITGKFSPMMTLPGINVNDKTPWTNKRFFERYPFLKNATLCKDNDTLPCFSISNNDIRPAFFLRVYGAMKDAKFHENQLSIQLSFDLGTREGDLLSTTEDGQKIIATSSDTSIESLNFRFRDHEFPNRYIGGRDITNQGTTFDLMDLSKNRELSLNLDHELDLHRRIVTEYYSFPKAVSTGDSIIFYDSVFLREQGLKQENGLLLYAYRYNTPTNLAYVSLEGINENDKILITANGSYSDELEWTPGGYDYSNVDAYQLDPSITIVD